MKTYLIREWVWNPFRANLYVQVSGETKRHAIKDYTTLIGREHLCLEVWELIKGIACVPTPD